MTFFATNLANKLLASAGALFASYILVTAAIGPVPIA
jgi:hypothetical protein